MINELIADLLTEFDPINTKSMKKGDFALFKSDLLEISHVEKPKGPHGSRISFLNGTWLYAEEASCIYSRENINQIKVYIKNSMSEVKKASKYFDNKTTL